MVFERPIHTKIAVTAVITVLGVALVLAMSVLAATGDEAEPEEVDAATSGKTVAIHGSYAFDVTDLDVLMDNAQQVSLDVS